MKFTTLYFEGENLMKNFNYLRLLSFWGPLLLAMSILSLTAQAGNIPRDVQIIVYTSANSGLPHDSVWAIAKDSKNNMWFGTRQYPNSGGGLAKLNGDTWTVYDENNSDVPSNAVWALAIDKNDKIWVGTFSNGAALFDGNNEWTVFNTGNSDLPDNEAEWVSIDKNNNAWWGTDNGLAMFDSTTKKWTVYTADNSGLPDEDPVVDEANEVESVYINEDNTLWVTTDGGGVALFDHENDKWTVYDTSNSDIASDQIECVEVAPDGKVWFGTTHHDPKGLIRFDGTNWKTFNKQNSGLKDLAIDDIGFDSKKNMWVATHSGGAAVYDGENWKNFTKENSNLPSNKVYCLFVDDDDSIWFGTEKGLAHLIPETGGDSDTDSDADSDTDSDADSDTEPEDPGSGIDNPTSSDSGCSCIFTGSKSLNSLTWKLLSTIL
jgi:ligand-binding sensor domain-containing protein